MSAPGPDYGKQAYWNSRYEEQGISPIDFEWYQKYEEFREHYDRELGDAVNVLHVGTGNSGVPVDVVAALPEQHIVSIDYADVVVAQMMEKHAGVERVEWRCADCTNMPEFADNSFDGAFDKGTLDAIVCGHSSVEDATKYMNEMVRVLKPGAKFVMMSLGSPPFRLEHLERGAWADIRCEVIGKAAEREGAKPTVHHFYVCTKAADESAAE